MGQKINPIGLRLGINRTWDSRWFAGKNEYGKLLHEDVKIREILHKELKQAAVARIVIERPHKKCRVDGHAALLVRTLDHDPGDGGLLELLVQDLADLDILVQQLAVLVLAGEPTRIPGPVDAEPQSDWIDLLTHRSLPRP